VTAGFELRCSWRRRSPPDPFDPEAVSDASALVGAYERFSALHEGQVEMAVGDVVLALDLDRDVAQVIEVLPGALERVLAGDSANLLFPEQGTDLALDVSRRHDCVAVVVRTGRYARPELAALPHELPLVSVAEFVDEWCRCLERLLDAVEECDPSLASDASYRAYRAQLAALR
jgi:hypothetical protein